MLVRLYVTWQWKAHEFMFHGGFMGDLHGDDISQSHGYFILISSESSDKI